jgi:hypothetical protein
MSLFSTGPGYGPEPLLSYLVENGLTKGKVVDIGGSHGYLYSVNGSTIEGFRRNVGAEQSLDLQRFT